LFFCLPHAETDRRDIAAPGTQSCLGSAEGCAFRKGGALKCSFSWRFW
jgi:hypothetical protein